MGMTCHSKSKRKGKGRNVIRFGKYGKRARWVCKIASPEDEDESVGPVPKSLPSSDTLPEDMNSGGLEGTKDVKVYSRDDQDIDGNEELEEDCDDGEKEGEK